MQKPDELFYVIGSEEGMSGFFLYTLQAKGYAKDIGGTCHRYVPEDKLHQLSEDHSHCEDLLHELGERASRAEGRLEEVSKAAELISSKDSELRRELAYWKMIADQRGDALDTACIKDQEQKSRLASALTLVGEVLDGIAEPAQWNPKAREILGRVETKEFDMLAELKARVVESPIRDGRATRDIAAGEVIEVPLEEYRKVVERLNPFVVEPPRGEIVNPHVQPYTPEPDKWGEAARTLRDGSRGTPQERADKATTLLKCTCDYSFRRGTTGHRYDCPSLIIKAPE